MNYENEAEVGAAVRRAGDELGVARDELLVTTKIPGRDHGYDSAMASAERSLATLGLDRIDLYLIHWPNPSVDKYLETWQAMIALREGGLVGSIGVSNFTEAMLTRLIDETGVTPAVNQVELHPYFPQGQLRAFHREHGIRTESWSPLARRSELLSEPVIGEIAAAQGSLADAGRPAVARAARVDAHPEVGRPRPSGRERGCLRLQPHRRPGRGDLGPRARSSVGRRPRHPRRDVVPPQGLRGSSAIHSEKVCVPSTASGPGRSDPSRCARPRAPGMLARTVMPRSPGRLRVRAHHVGERLLAWPGEVRRSALGGRCLGEVDEPLAHFAHRDRLNPTARRDVQRARASRIPTPAARTHGTASPGRS